MDKIRQLSEDTWKPVEFGVCMEMKMWPILLHGDEETATMENNHSITQGHAQPLQVRLNQSPLLLARRPYRQPCSFHRLHKKGWYFHKFRPFATSFTMPMRGREQRYGMPTSMMTM